MQLFHGRCLALQAPPGARRQALGSKLSQSTAARPQALLLLHSTVGLHASAGSRHGGRVGGAPRPCHATLTEQEEGTLEEGTARTSREVTEAIVEAVPEGGSSRNYVLRLPDGRTGILAPTKASTTKQKSQVLVPGETVWCHIITQEPLEFSLVELELFRGEMGDDKAAVFDRARQYANWRMQRGGDGTFPEFLGHTMLSQFLAPRTVPEQKPELSNRMSAFDEVVRGQLLEAEVVRVTTTLVSLYVPSLDVYGKLHVSQVSQRLTTTEQLFSTFTPGAKVLVNVSRVERKNTPGVQPYIFFSTRDLEAEPGLVHKSLAKYNEKAPAVYMQYKSQWLSRLMDEAEQLLERWAPTQLPSLEGAVDRLFKCTVLNVTPYGAFVQLETGHVGLCHISQMSQRRVASVPTHLSAGSEVVMQLKSILGSHLSMSTKRLEEEQGEFLDAPEAMMTRLRQAWEEQPPLPAAESSTAQPNYSGDKVVRLRAAAALLKVPTFCMLGAARHTTEARQALRRYTELLERFEAALAREASLYQPDVMAQALPPSGAPGLRIKLQALRACQVHEWVSSQDTDVQQSLPSITEALGQALAALPDKSIPNTKPVVASNQVLSGLSDALLCLRVVDQTLHQQAVQAWLVACTPQIVQVLCSDINVERLLDSRLIQLLASNGWFAAHRQAAPAESQEMLELLFERLLRRLVPSHSRPGVPYQDAHPSRVQAGLYNIKALLNLARMVGYQPTDTWWGLLFQRTARGIPEIMKATDLDQLDAVQLKEVKTIAAAVCGARIPM